MTVVLKDGAAKYFCSSKCRKNFLMGRLTKKVKWVQKSDLVKAEKAKKDAAYKSRQEEKKKEEEKKAAVKTKKRK